ncbi:MAG: tRNA-dihydrouridine synthase [Verrucomicrobiota bacterium]
MVAAVRTIPVIGNGDVTTPQAARRMLDATGCAGVSIGRGAFYNPWIFAHTQHYLATGELLPEPDFAERLRVMNRHFDLMIEVFGEPMGCTMFRKVGPWYAKRFGPASVFNKGIVQVSTRADYEVLVEKYLAWRAQFLDADGRLLPRYSPAPQAMNFRDDEMGDIDDVPAVARREAIPVPAGPNELW